MSPTNVLRVASLALILASVSGCSLFGVATKGELETHAAVTRQRAEALAEENRQLREQLGVFERRLEDARARAGERDQRLETVLSQAEEDRLQLWSQTGEFQSRLEGMEDGVVEATQVAAGLGEEVAEVHAVVAAVDEGVQAVRADLGAVAGDAQSALVRSEQLVTVRLDQLRRERRRLIQELRELETELEAWNHTGDLRTPAAQELPGRRDQPVDEGTSRLPGDSSR